MGEPQPTAGEQTFVPSGFDDQDEFNVGYYCVALVDVLSQSQLLSLWSSIPEDESPSTEFMTGLRKTVGTVSAIRQNLASYIRAFATTGPDPRLLAMMSRQDYRLLLEHKKLALEVQSFSDTSVLYAPLRPIGNVISLHDIFCVLAGFCIYFPMALSAKVPLRGAIDVGVATNFFPGEVYGPALATAYHMESKLAEWPRILIGDRLVSLLQEFASSEGAGIDRQFVRNISQLMLRQIITRDGDGRWILHYLGPFTRAHSQVAHLSVANEISKAYEFINSSLDNFRAENDKKLAVRYEHLKGYFDAHLPDWGLITI